MVCFGYYPQVEGIEGPLFLGGLSFCRLIPAVSAGSG